MPRCPWPADDPQMLAYHDTEWGVPCRDDRVHFEFLILEAAQAGLSWRTVLHRRSGYRRAFAGFDPKKVARFTAEDEARLLQDPGIIRNRLKIHAAVNNAARFLDVQQEFGSFATYLWSFTKGVPVLHRWTRQELLPACTPLSDRVSRDLKTRGFTFVGPTVIYAHLQATGIVNDHLVSCPRWKAVQRISGQRV